MISDNELRFGTRVESYPVENINKYLKEYGLDKDEAKINKILEEAKKDNSYGAFIRDFNTEQ